MITAKRALEIFKEKNPDLTVIGMSEISDYFTFSIKDGSAAIINAISKETGEENQLSIVDYAKEVDAGTRKRLNIQKYL